MKRVVGWSTVSMISPALTTAPNVRHQTRLQTQQRSATSQYKGNGFIMSPDVISKYEISLIILVAYVKCDLMI